MYSMNQYTHSVSRVCALTAWIFNKLSKSKQEPVSVQWGYCWHGVRVIETPLYEYWPDMRFKNLIVVPFLLSTLTEFPFRRLVADVITAARWGKLYHKNCRLYGIRGPARPLRKYRNLYRKNFGKIQDFTGYNLEKKRNNKGIIKWYLFS